MVIGKLAEKVISKLGIYDGTSLEPGDLANVADAYAGVYQTLADDGLVTWVYSASDDADIPDRFSLPLIDLIRAEIADFYTVPAPPEGWEKIKLAATNRIRRQLASAQPTETVEAEYF